jgi:hypothetical protein
MKLFSSCLSIKKAIPFLEMALKLFYRSFFTFMTKGLKEG